MGTPFPLEELTVIDVTIRMFTQPVLRGDIDLLAKVWESEDAKKKGRLEALNVTPAELQSADKFKALLEAEGVEIEYKDGKRGPIPCFAKTDQFMRDLLEHEDDRVRALAEARLGQKSTLMQTRAETLGWMASRGPLPVYLRYAGAHTTRWSGGDGCNWQNFTRGSDIRKAIMAPAGHLLAPIDLSQIECRILNYLAGQEDVIERFRRNEDPYVGIAAQFYGREITRNDAAERGTGKQLELSCGYGCGAQKFQAVAKLGIYGPPVIIPLEEAKRAVDLYRRTHARVVEYWRTAGRMISRLAGGPPCEWGPMQVKDGKIYLPNGCPLDYSTLEFYREENEGRPAYEDGYWRMKTRNGWSKLYGAKLVENCLSGATIVLTDKGWRHIINVTPGDRLWDGASWVEHSGLIMRGLRTTLPLNGVRMTSDHEVLTTNGWIRAAFAKGFDRAEVRLPDSYSGYRDDGAETPLVDSMYLRDRIYAGHKHLQKATELWLQDERNSSIKKADSWNVKTPSLLGMAFHGRSVPATITSSLEKLWRAWHSCLQPLVRQFRSFLERYGTYLSPRAYIGTQGQFQRVHTEKLYVGRSSSTSAQPPNKSADRNSMGQDNSAPSSTMFRAWGDDGSISNYERLAPGNVAYQAKYTEPTYDILNCGPQNRFVVLGDTGPFIVHNCVQALARVVMSQAMIRITRLGYRIVNTTHDEILVLIPKDGRQQEHLETCMAEMKRTPDWLSGIPLDCEGALGERYAK